MFVGLSLTATWGIFYKNLVQYFCYKAVELRNTVYFGAMPPNESFSSDAAEMDIHSKTDDKCKVIFCYIAPASRFLENFNKQMIQFLQYLRPY